LVGASRSQKKSELQISPNLVGGLRGQLPRQCLCAPLLRRPLLLKGDNPSHQRHRQKSVQRLDQAPQPNSRRCLLVGTLSLHFRQRPHTCQF
jgi:hypothetical protein